MHHFRRVTKEPERTLLNKELVVSWVGIRTRFSLVADCGADTSVEVARENGRYGERRRTEDVIKQSSIPRLLCLPTHVKNCANFPRAALRPSEQRG